MDVEPREVNVGSESVTISWTDGAVTAIPGRRLRSLCPCAECREHESAATSFIEIDDRSTIVDARLIGGYALRFTFGDGHADGIYAYHVLREMGAQ